MDSDFDIDETEEVVQDDGDEDDEKKKHRGRIVTKAYVDPKARKPGTSRKIIVDSRKRKRTESTSSIEGEGKGKRQKTEEEDDDEESDEDSDDAELSSEDSEAEGKSKKDDAATKLKDMPSFEPKPYDTPTKRKPGRPRRDSPSTSPLKAKQVSFFGFHDGNRVRSSTKQKSQDTEARLKERKKVEARRRERFKSRREEMAKAPPLTQEELLKEAEETAKLNLESLGELLNLQMRRNICVF